MGTAQTVGTGAIQIALAVGFIGLAVLGIVLIGMAVTLPGAILKRIAILILGVGGVVIAIGYLQTTRAQL